VGRGTETILLVEDDAAVRRLMKSVLERNGYAIVEAVDGAEAIDRFREHQDRIGLLVLDVIMPKKNGKEAYAAIKKERPGVKAIFVSGYTADLLSDEGTLEKGASFLSKPVAPSVLLKKVREILDAGTDRPPASL
jgi:CheY-like chemotaxis protein